MGAGKLHSVIGTWGFLDTLLQRCWLQQEGHPACENLHPTSSRETCVGPSLKDVDSRKVGQLNMPRTCVCVRACVRACVCSPVSEPVFISAAVWKG